MINSDAFTTMHLTAVLENAPVAVYICGVDDYELLYANALAKKMFLKQSDSAEGTCYQAMGFTERCPFCQMDRMNQSQFLIREFKHPANGRIYQLSGRIIEWDGRLAHVEYITDITERKQEENQSEALKERLQMVFGNIPCGLCVYTFDGRTIAPVFHNQVFYEIMGYSEEHIRALEQETGFLGVHPEDLSSLSDSIQRAIQCNGIVQYTYRVFSDKRKEYRWIHLEGSVKKQPDGNRLLYAVYSDVSEQRKLEIELAKANEQMQDIINAIPGGIAVYKVTDILKNVYVSDGVPELSGYTAEEYNELADGDVLKRIYKEDAGMVEQMVRKAIETHKAEEFEFRSYHKSGYIVWVRARVKWIGDEGGCPLIHCVLQNISALKETQMELNHLVNSIPGGIASYRVVEGRFIPTFFSAGVAGLTGHTREEYARLVLHDAVDTVYELDRERVRAAALAAFINGSVLDVFFRMRHKDGSLVWLHLNGRRLGPLSEYTKFYTVFTGMSPEARLYQNIVNETADGIYVINKANYDLLYAYDSDNLFAGGTGGVGEKCYSALHGKDSPCEFCALKRCEPDGKAREMVVEETGRYYSGRVWETEWNRIPAYIQYIQDITEEVAIRKEKNRLEQYFQTLVEKLPGGVAVVRCEDDGSMTQEFLSDEFAAMTGMSLEEAWELYREDSIAGVHPEDREKVRTQMEKSFAEGESRREITYRLQKGDGTYIWVKNTYSVMRGNEGTLRIYSVYHDMTAERKEQEQIRRQYKDLLMQHYRTVDPNALIVGHCDVTQNRMLELIDHTDSELLRRFGFERDGFYTGLSGLIADCKEQQEFRNVFLNVPALEAFAAKNTELIQTSFVTFPGEKRGRYVCFKVKLVEAPDTGDVTGILTVTDVTDQTIADRILHQLSVTSHDFVIDLDLEKDRFTVLAKGTNAQDISMSGSHSQRISWISERGIVPKDAEHYANCLQPQEIYRRLNEEGTYTFAYSFSDEKGCIRTKNMMVSAADLRLGRVCLVRNDITDFVREQQGMLNMIAYTFELAGVIDVQSSRLTMHTRRTVLENLPPYVIEDYNAVVSEVANVCKSEEDWEAVLEQFRLKTMMNHLETKTAGYDFVYPYCQKSGDSIRYKQVNVLWGDADHRAVCIVRADVTDMISAERQSKKTLEAALNFAEKANQAKSEFLSAMSHDIRTPMNAIIGMTTLAQACLDDKEKVADCLRKVSVSSEHLLSLINDILDMSKIEHSKITLGHMRLSFPELIEQLNSMMAPQARAAGLQFDVRTRNIRHNYFYGDGLRTNQVLLNILSNAVKFTPKGGRVEFLAEELQPVISGQNVRYCFTISDTGKGMSEEFLETMFEPFARSGNVSCIEGTGLGLSITKGLVDRMGGSITVKSRINKGSVFRVELEYEVASEEIDSGSAQANPNGAKKEKLFAGRCFLVAEDNAINAEILTELLKLEGAESVVRIDGEQAVQAFRESRQGTYDAILMDIQMPNMSGYEATRVIRELKRADARQIPIIAMTANAFAEDVQASLDAGMTAHVSKPINLEVLRETLISVIG